MIIQSGVVIPADDHVKYHCEVSAHLRTEQYGLGNLYISETAVTWKALVGDIGFSLTYNSLIMFAISRDRSNFPENCIYIMVDCRRNEFSMCGDDVMMDNEQGDNDDENDPECVLILVPSDEAKLHEIYHQLSIYQQRNAIEELSDYEDSDDCGNYEFQDAVGDDSGGDFQLTVDGQSNLDRIMSNSGYSDPNDPIRNGGDVMEQE